MSARKGPHPWLFSVLILPYGSAFGFVAFALPILAVRHDVPEATMGKIVASTFLVHTIKPLWAPLVDTTLSRRTWYLIANLLTAFGAFVTAAMPISKDHLGALTAVLLASQIGLTLMGMACEGFLALAVPEEEKGRASGFYNAAIYVGNGLGGWFALKLASWLPEGWMVGAVYAAIMLPCSLPLLALHIPRAEEHAHTLRHALRQLGRDLRSLVRSRFGLTGLIIALSPVGAGAVQNLFGATAGRWGLAPPYTWTVFGTVLDADDILGLVGGLLGAILSAAGALLGGWLADRVPRRLAYAGAGFSMAICAIGMALAARAPWAYVLFGSFYNFFTGLAFAAFTSFVLETIGHGAVATKYNIFAGCANFAIFYSGTADSFALERFGADWGTTGMLFSDALLTMGGITLLLVMLVMTRQRNGGIGTTQNA
jgi:MFS family permease